MTNIFKVVLGAGLVTGIILYLVLAGQNKQDTDIQLQQRQTDKSIADFNADFEKKSHRPDTDIIAREEAASAEAAKNIQDLKKRQAEQQEKADGVSKDFDTAVKSLDASLVEKDKKGDKP